VKTTRGTDWEIAIISVPENLANLGRYKDISRRLADGRGLNDQTARSLAREGKAIVILPDASPQQIRDGFGPDTVPGEFEGGLGSTGASALREFVTDGGTLITFNDASLYAIQDLGLPVKNVLAGGKPEDFYCSGSLLRVELQDTTHSVVAGLPREPIVMFERGPAFETTEGFRGRILATYPKNQNPLMSGYLLHPDRIQGKAALLEVQYGNGRIYLFGFRPQWRGQSHGTYKFIFNALYESQGLSQPGLVTPVPKS
jgi:hypothetical protein